MKICHAHLKSITPYSQSKQHGEQRQDKESWEDWENRTWRMKAHVNGENLIFIPPMAFKQCLDAAAQFLSIKIKGRGHATYTKHFLSGVLVMDEILTEFSPDNVPGEWISANANGKRGSGTRVPRCFPVIPHWEGDIAFNILDDTITEEIFERVLSEGGSFIGIGRFRPQNGGFLGRFKVEKTRWEHQ